MQNKQGLLSRERQNGTFFLNELNLPTYNPRTDQRNSTFGIYLLVMYHGGNIRGSKVIVTFGVRLAVLSVWVFPKARF
jgi:hypothetical protein